MFLIDKEKNEAISISKKTFQELEFKERKHLQEWISKKDVYKRQVYIRAIENLPANPGYEYLSQINGSFSWFTS